MRVEVWFDRSSQPIRFDNVYATYQKGDLFCVGYKDADGRGTVAKYPLDHIFTIAEYDFESSQPTL